MASGGPVIRSLGRTLVLRSYLSRAIGVASPRGVGFADKIAGGKDESLRTALQDVQAFSTEAPRGIAAGIDAKAVWPLKSSNQSLEFYSSLAGSAVEEQGEGEGGSVQENVVEPQAEPAPVREQQGEQESNSAEPQAIGSKEELINTAGKTHFDVLLQNVRAWPVDVDLNKKLKGGNLGGRPLKEGVVAGVLNALSMNIEQSSHDKSVPLERQMSEDTDSEGGEVAPAKAASAMEYDAGNAHRALNLVNWWRNQHPDQPFDLLVTPLLFCLAKANLLDEISAFANDYAVEFRKHSLIAAALIKVYCTTGLFGAAVDVYHKARENSVFLGSHDIARVLQALAALGSPAAELLAFYRDTEHKQNLPTSSFEALLGAGVAVDDLYVPDDKSTEQLEFRLIAALVSLGRLDEAKAFVARTFLQPVQPDMTLTKLIATLKVLEKCGLIEEAEQLAERQRSEKQVSLAGALHFTMKNARDSKKAAQAYESVMRLKGEHQENFALHIGAIDVFSKLRDEDSTWQVGLPLMDRPSVVQRLSSCQTHVASFLELLWRLQGSSVETECVSLFPDSRRSGGAEHF
jgi:hypothetical protein